MREIRVRIISPNDKPEDYFYTTIHPLEEGCRASTLTIHKDDIVSLYTGLKDKNGVEIYEGDIVRLSNNQIGNVFYDDLSGASFDVNLKQGKYALLYLATARASFDAYVVGNIHENPELLEE